MDQPLSSVVSPPQTEQQFVPARTSQAKASTLLPNQQASHPAKSLVSTSPLSSLRVSASFSKGGKSPRRVASRSWAKMSSSSARCLLLLAALCAASQSVTGAPVHSQLPCQGNGAWTRELLSSVAQPVARASCCAAPKSGHRKLLCIHGRPAAQPLLHIRSCSLLDRALSCACVPVRAGARLGVTLPVEEEVPQAVAHQRRLQQGDNPDQVEIQRSNTSSVGTHFDVEWEVG